MAVVQTLVLIKPDGLKKSLTGDILSRLSEAQLEIVGAKMVRVSQALAEEHYESLKDKPFFGELIDYIMGELHECRKVMALVYHGEDAIGKIRRICGATHPEEAEPRSVRGAYGRITTTGAFENVVHSSANLDDAEREIKLWFSPHEIVYHVFAVKEAEVRSSQLVWA